MLRENKILCVTIAVAVAVLLLPFVRAYYGGITGFREITQNEMLLRFGQADYIQFSFDKVHNMDVKKFYYRIENDTLFLMFVYSWSGTLVDFDTVRGYRDWHFRRHGLSLHEY